jgi:hypothetical protein
VGPTQVEVNRQVGLGPASPLPERANAFPNSDTEGMWIPAPTGHVLHDAFKMSGAVPSMPVTHPMSYSVAIHFTLDAPERHQPAGGA